MKIIQLNMWNGRLERAIINFLKEEKADIVCLQEVISLEGGAGGWFLLPLEDLMVQLDSKSLYAPFLNFNFMNRRAEVGNAILTNMPVVHEATIFTGGEYLEGFDSKEATGNINNLLHASMDLPSGKLHVLTHHGYLVPGTKEGNGETLRQCTMIADYVAKLDGAVILTGDFNLSPRSQSIELLSQTLTNLSIKNNLTSTYSEFGKNKEVCDYIFVNDKVEVKDFKVSNTIVSDHLALIMEF